VKESGANDWCTKGTRDVVAKAVEPLGGAWDTQRAVTALRYSGHEPADLRAAEKEHGNPVWAIYRSPIQGGTPTVGRPDHP
jgi:hypothetical protein